MKTTQEMSAVNVAKDVIAQIKAERLIATQGDYCTVYADAEPLDDWLYNLPGVYEEYDEDYHYSDHYRILNGSFQELYQEENIKCEVCAIGAVFISFVNLYNEMTTNEVNDVSSHSMLSKVSGVFSKILMRTMERIFEGEWIRLREEFYAQDFIINVFNENNTDDQPGETYIEEQLGSMRTDRDGYTLSPEEVILSLMQNIIDNDGALMIPGVGLVK